MKKIALYLLASLSLFGSELDALLDNYAVENDLSNQTKIEKTGSTQLIVYTREDLDRLQYESLKDILVMQRFYTYRENRLGQIDLIDAEPYSIGKAGQVVKIYIDDFELTTLQYDSMIQLLGNIELDFVDHLEIYQGPPSFDITTQSSIVTFKLYSKEPTRDNGQRVGLQADHRGSFNSFFHTGNADNDLKYFLYLQTTNYQSDIIKNGATDLSRDEQRKHLFSTFEYKDNHFLFQYLTKEKDAFLTNSLDGTPLKDDMENSLLHVAYKRNFLDDGSLKFKTNFTRAKSRLNALDDSPYLPTQYTSVTASTNQLIALSNPLALIASGIVTSSGGLFDANTPITFTNSGIYGERYKSTDDVFTTELTKEYTLDKHQILLGLSFRDKRLSYSTNEYLSSAGTITVGGMPVLGYEDTLSSVTKPTYLTNQQIYSAFVQDTYKLDAQNTIALGFKIEQENNNYYDDATLYTARISHTYEKDSWMFMTYYTHMETNKNSYYFNTVSPSKLDNEKTDIWGHETKYKTDNFDINYNILYITMPNLIFVDSSFENYNMSENYRLLLNSLMLNYHYNDNTSFMLEPWHQYIKAEEMNNFKSYAYGLNVRVVNKIDNFTIYNELVLLKNNPKYLPDAYEFQYNLGVTYKVNKDLSVYLKGTNIFNGRSGFSYYNYENKTKNINSVPETYMIGLEYTF